MSMPMNVKFTTTTTDYDLFSDSIIEDQITKHFGTSIVNDIKNGTAYMSLTVFVDTPSKIKFSLDDNYQEFIKDVVFSSGGFVNPTHCYIKDTGISGTLSIQIR